MVDQCSNNGIIIGNGILNTVDNLYHADTGGIVGRSDESSTITNSHNNNVVKIIEEENKNKIDFGGIVGCAINSTIISKCYNKGEIGSLSLYISNVGGISGELGNNAKVSKCYNENKVSGHGSVGGIVGIQGHNSNAYVENCYNIGDITVNYGSVGGISFVTSSTTKSEIRNCYNVGNIKVISATNNAIGSIVGTGNNTNTIVTNCYYLEGTYNVGINVKDTEETVKKQESEMTTQDFVDKLNEGNTDETVWKKDEKGGYPIFN